MGIDHRPVLESSMGLSGALFGLACAVISAVIWARVFLVTNKEYAWLASAIGALVGSGAYLADGLPAGPYAVALTVLALAIAKIVALRIAAERFLSSVIDYAVREKTIALLARDVMGEERRRGRHLDGEGDNIPLDRVERKHFPADVWTVATGRLDALSSHEQAELEDVAKQGVGEFSPLMKRFSRVILLKSNFTRVDLLFYLIASLTAYAFGSGFVYQ